MDVMYVYLDWICVLGFGMDRWCECVWIRLDGEEDLFATEQVVYS